MKQFFLVLLTVSSLPFLSAQISFNTGDVSFDADLNVINTNASKDLTAFKSDLTVSFGVSLPTIDNMFSISMQPAEVYLALEIASVTKKPVTDVVTVYKKNKGKGWGVIAQEMGIKPGSDMFHTLKGKATTRKSKGASKGNGNSNGNGKGK
jgi:hypothetical protein